VGLVVGKVALGQVFSEYFGIPTEVRINAEIEEKFPISNKEI
jgi:hypothetical protein